MTLPEPVRQTIGGIAAEFHLTTKSTYPILLLFIVTCALQHCASVSANKVGDTRTKPVEFIDENTYLLLEATNDRTYAFKPSNPVRVGSGDGSGPLNERRFLNALAGPGGEQIEYFRAGSCCPFKTPNGLLDNTGMLDHYRIFWEGSKDTLDIYINMYDEGDLMVPVGLTAKRKD